MSFVKQPCEKMKAQVLLLPPTNQTSTSHGRRSYFVSVSPQLPHFSPPLNIAVAAADHRLSPQDRLREGPAGHHLGPHFSFHRRRGFPVGGELEQSVLQVGVQRAGDRGGERARREASESLQEGGLQGRCLARVPEKEVLREHPRQAQEEI